MSPSVILAFAGTIVIDVIGQIAFKLGLNGSGEGPLWRRVLGSPMTMTGVVAYALEFLLWLYVLSAADLSVAFPVAAIAYGGVLLASRLVLGERVSRRRWLGVAIITLGVGLVLASA